MIVLLKDTSGMNMLSENMLYTSTDARIIIHVT